MQNAYRNLLKQKSSQRNANVKSYLWGFSKLRYKEQPKKKKIPYRHISIPNLHRYVDIFYLIATLY